MPAAEELLPRFRAADTQVLGISIDSVFSHSNWAQSLGGVSFPLLQDFEPKGAVARSFGLYLEKAGITDRATVIIDKQGVVQFKESVTPAGKRDLAELASKCEEVQGKQEKGSWKEAQGPASGSVLFVKSGCGHSQKALLALANLRLAGQVTVKNVSEDAAAREELTKHGKDQAPCLVHDGEAIYEADEIVRLLVDRCAPMGC